MGIEVVHLVAKTSLEPVHYAVGFCFLYSSLYIFHYKMF